MSLGGFWGRLGYYRVVIFFAGLVLGIATAPTPAFFIPIMVLVLACLLVGGYRHGFDWRWVGWALTVVLFAYGVVAMRQVRHVDPVLQELLGTVHTATLVVASAPKQSRRTTRFVGQMFGTRVMVTVAKKALSRELVLGDQLVVSGVLEWPELPRNPGAFNYKLYLARKGIHAIYRVQDVTSIYRTRAFLFSRTIQRFKIWLNNRIRSTLPFPYGELYIGLVFGDFGVFLPDDWEAQFQVLGLTHLLVVSGAQVALLAGIVLAVFRYVGLSPVSRFVWVTVVNSLFYFLTGGGASIFRAILMFEIMLGLQLLKRRTHPLHVMSLTALIMLLVRPAWLVSLGAQLSFMAVVSLVFCAPALSARLPSSIPRVLRDMIGVTVAPFLLSFPLLWYAFGQLSLVSLLSNFLVVQAIEGLVILGFFSTLFGLLFLPIMQLLNNVAYLIMWILIKLVSVLSFLPFGQLFVAAPSLWVILGCYVLNFMAKDRSFSDSPLPGPKGYRISKVKPGSKFSDSGADTFMRRIDCARNRASYAAVFTSDRPLSMRAAIGPVRSKYGIPPI